MTDKLAREQGYIDVTFVNLTEERERQERRHNLLGAAFTALCGLAGFLFWPMVALWETGVDLTEEIARSGNIWYGAILLSIFFATGLFTTLIGLAVWGGRK